MLEFIKTAAMAIVGVPLVCTYVTGMAARALLSTGGRLRLTGSGDYRAKTIHVAQVPDKRNGKLRTVYRVQRWYLEKLLTAPADALQPLEKEVLSLLQTVINSQSEETQVVSKGDTVWLIVIRDRERESDEESGERQTRRANGVADWESMRQKQRERPDDEDESDLDEEALPWDLVWYPGENDDAEGDMQEMQEMENIPQAPVAREEPDEEDSETESEAERRYNASRPANAEQYAVPVECGYESEDSDLVFSFYSSSELSSTSSSEDEGDDNNENHESEDDSDEVGEELSSSFSALSSVSSLESLPDLTSFSVSPAAPVMQVEVASVSVGAERLLESKVEGQCYEVSEGGYICINMSM
ncbi:protein A27 [Aotine betaherpesvirus 1]|uniref:Protein A27 n=1 Tax=Aotine betaherpesvirus 1 TaxID=50290 RepID=G8XUK1_9BETA|nr:protein A27 [Aotine betaherpesvirus 1]AEV80843.1 protein A27 [Aotine betaherpesvirus 1]